MEQHRTHGFVNFTIEPIEIFARQCDVTGEGMNSGFCILDGDMYIKHEKDMVRHLRENFADIIGSTAARSEADEFDDYDISLDPDKMSDKELMETCYDTDYFMYTEWTADDADEDYVILQKAAHMLTCNDFDVCIVGDKIELTAWNSRLDLTTEVFIQQSDVEEWAKMYDEMTKTEQS